MRYQVILARSVQKEIDRLAEPIAERILSALAELESQPRPVEAKLSIVELIRPFHFQDPSMSWIWALVDTSGIAGP